MSGDPTRAQCFDHVKWDLQSLLCRERAGPGSGVKGGPEPRREDEVDRWSSLDPSVHRHKGRSWGGS